MEINGPHVQTEVDTGASLSVVNEKMLKELGCEGQSHTPEPILAKFAYIKVK